MTRSTGSPRWRAASTYSHTASRSDAASAPLARMAVRRFAASISREVVGAGGEPVRGPGVGSVMCKFDVRRERLRNRYRTIKASSSTTTTAWSARHWHSHCAPNLDRRVVIRGRVVMLINVDEGSGPYDRRYVDRSGILWCVRERLLREWGRALYFESVIGFRRVTHYPPDWRELPTAELEILSFTR